MFNVVRIYSDENGDSHFENVQIPLKDAGDIGLLSDSYPAKNIFFREVLPGYDYDFHTAPQRQYIILPDGQIQIETSVGEIRQFGAGDVLLVEDTTGKGHRTKNIIPAKRRSIFITI